MVPADHLEITPDVRAKKSTIDLNDRPTVVGISVMAVMTEAIDSRERRSGARLAADTSKTRQ